MGVIEARGFPSLAFLITERVSEMKRRFLANPSPKQGSKSRLLVDIYRTSQQLNKSRERERECETRSAI